MLKYNVPFSLDVLDIEIEDSDISLYDNRIDIELCRFIVKSFEKPFKIMTQGDKVFFTHPDLPLVPEEAIAFNQKLERYLNEDDILGYRNYFHIKESLMNMFKKNEIDLYVILSFKDLESLFFNNEQRFFTYSNFEKDLRTTGLKVELIGEKDYFKYGNFSIISLINSHKLQQDTIFFYENGDKSILAWLENNRFRTKFYHIPKDKKAFKFRYHHNRNLKDKDRHNALLEGTIDQIQFNQLNVEDERFWATLIEEMLDDFDQEPERFVGKDPDEKRQRENILLARYYIERLPFHELARHSETVPGSKAVLIHFLNKLENYLLKITV